MELRLERLWPKETYTIGRLYINNEFFCNTLEDKIVDKNKNGIFDNAVIFQFHQQAVPVNLQKLFRCILLRQTEPFKDSDLDLFSRKKLLSNSPFQIPDVLFMN